jgi:hypothetical protein
MKITQEYLDKNIGRSMRVRCSGAEDRIGFVAETVIMQEDGSLVLGGAIIVHDKYENLDEFKEKGFTYPFHCRRILLEDVSSIAPIDLWKSYSTGMS